MVSSKRLGKIIGLYMMIVGMAMILRMDEFTHLIQNLMQDKPLMFVTGFFTLILGLIMVVSHNVWQRNWRLINTLIGWIVLLKGSSLILYPHVMDQLTLLFLQHTMVAYSAAGMDVVLGCVLCYFSFKR